MLKAVCLVERAMLDSDRGSYVRRKVAADGKAAEQVEGSCLLRWTQQ